MGTPEDYLCSRPESQKNVLTSDSLILQIAISIEMSAAVFSSAMVPFWVMCVSPTWKGKAEQECGDSTSLQMFNNNSYIHEIQ